MVHKHSLKDDDPHRLRCPVGHSGWKPINGHFWCPHCAKSSWEREASFEHVRDAKTGDLLDREDVQALEDALAGAQS